MTKTTQAKVIRKGFGYLEGFRWHNNELWFSDIQKQTVYRMSSDASALKVAASLEIKPSGLGFPQNSDPLVVGMGDSTLRRIKSNQSTEVVVDLSDYADQPNDMWVEPTSGRAYISQIGFDLFGGESPQPSHMIIVQPDGTVQTGGSGVVCPNGVQLTADGKTLVVAETITRRLSAFDVDEEGLLSNQRVIIEYEDPLALLDGLVIDAEDGIWVTVPMHGEVRRITLDGTVTDIVQTADEGFVVSGALGGPEGRTLYLATATKTDEVRQGNFSNLIKDGVSQIQAAEVSVPGVNS